MLRKKKSVAIIVGNMWQLQFKAGLPLTRAVPLFIYWYLDHTIFSLLFRRSLVTSIFNAQRVFPFLRDVHFLHTSTIFEKDIIDIPKKKSEKNFETDFNFAT